MRLFLTLFISIGMISATHASELSQIVANLQNTYQQINDWQAEFDQSTFVELVEKEIHKKGTIALKKSGKIKIQYQEEFGKLYLSNGKKFWVYTPGDSQVIVYSKISKILASEALTFLQGLGHIQNEFQVSLIDSMEINKAMMVEKNLKIIELVPKDPQSILQKIILGIDSSYKVKEITLFNESGNKTHYVFKNIRFNSNIADETFDFAKPKNVKVIKG